MHLSDGIERQSRNDEKDPENGEDYLPLKFVPSPSWNLFLIAILINHFSILLFQQAAFETIVLVMIVFSAVSAKSVITKKSERMMEKQVDELPNDSWANAANYISDWDHGEVRQITIEKKVPIFVEKIRHVPVIQKEYISVPRYITKPVYIERSFPVIIPRMQHYHHHHYSEYHHIH